MQASKQDGMLPQAPLIDKVEHSNQRATLACQAMPWCTVLVTGSSYLLPIIERVLLMPYTASNRVTCGCSPHTVNTAATSHCQRAQSKHQSRLDTGCAILA
jgi:hypothetical protein